MAYIIVELNALYFTVLFTSSLIWGFLYPDFFRIPFYFWVSLIFVLFNSPKLAFANGKLIAVLTALIMYSTAISVDAYSTLYIICIAVYLLVLSCSIEVAARDCEINRHNLVSCAMYAVLLSIAALFIDIIFGDRIFFSGLFPEPSHLGYTLGPILGYLLFAANRRWFAFISILILLIFSPSATLILSILQFLVLWRLRKLKVHLFVLTYVALISLSIAALWCLHDESFSWLIQSKSASFDIWVHGYVRAFDVLKDHSIFGVGPFGWLSEGELDASSLEVELMNQRDLASIVPFGIASVGILFPVVGYISLNYLAKFNRHDIYDSSVSIIALTYLWVFCFRWGGVTLSPILVLLSFVIAYRGAASKVTQRSAAT